MAKSRLLACLAILCMTGCHVRAQQQRKADSTFIPTEGKYFMNTSGVSYTSVRDRGNSPLFYRGLVTSTEMSLFKSNSKRDFFMGFNASQGNLQAIGSGTAYHQSYRHLRFSLYKMWNVYKIGDFTIKAGPGIESQTNNRINTELFNTYHTVENFSAITAHGNIEYSFGRAARNRKILFWKYSRPERRYKLNYHLTASALPLAFRPGYAYVDNIVINNPDYLGDHELQIGGYAVTSRITLTKYLSNGNAFQFGYTWKAMTSKKNQFEAGSHSITFAFQFKYK